MKECGAVCRWYCRCGLQVRFTCCTGCWKGVMPGTKYPAPYCCTGTCFAAAFTPVWHQPAGLLPMCNSWVCAWPGFFFFFPSLQRKKVWNFSKIRKPQKQLPYKYFNCLHQLQARLECQPLGLIITNPTIPSGCCKLLQEHQYSSGKIVKFSEICQDERKYMNGWHQHY